MFSIGGRVLSQCNTRLRLLYLFIKGRRRKGFRIACRWTRNRVETILVTKKKEERSVKVIGKKWYFSHVGVCNYYRFRIEIIWRQERKLIGIVTFQLADVKIHCENGRHAVKCVCPREQWSARWQLSWLTGQMLAPATDYMPWECRILPSTRKRPNWRSYFTYRTF